VDTDFNCPSFVPLIACMRQQVTDFPLFFLPEISKSGNWGNKPSKRYHIMKMIQH